MVKALHRSLEAKLASIKPTEYSDSDISEADDEHPETISAKRVSTATGKRTPGRDKKGTKSPSSTTDDDDGNGPSTVIYLGHLPVGFEERELTVFLTQFGNVARCRVSRSTKTGRSRCYAFVEFVDPEVATIVAETMSGYLLLEKRLVCHVLPKEKVDHELMFAKPKRVPTKKEKQKKARVEENKVRSVDAMKMITESLVKREKMKRKKLAEMGIDYDFPGYSASAVAADAAPPAAVTTKKDDAGSMKKTNKRKISHEADDGKNKVETKDDKESKTKNDKESKMSKKEKKSKNEKRKSGVVEEVERKESGETKNANETKSSAQKKAKKVKEVKIPNKKETTSKRA